MLCLPTQNHQRHAVVHKMNSKTETIISALRILARDIQTDDGVANACLDEAASRLQELQIKLKDAIELAEAAAHGSPYKQTPVLEFVVPEESSATTEESSVDHIGEVTEMVGKEMTE